MAVTPPATNGPAAADRVQESNRSRAVLKLAANVTWLLALAAVVILILAVQAWQIYAGTTFAYSGIVLAEDTRIGFTAKPNAELHYLLPPRFDAYTDDRGGREDQPGRKAPAAVDALFIGDSFVWGPGVQDIDTLPKTFGRRYGLSVFNAAVPAYSDVDALLSLDKFADLKPHFIVLGFTEMQLARNFTPCLATGFFLCRPNAYLDGGENHLEIRPPPDGIKDYIKYGTEIFPQHQFGWRDIYWAGYRDISMTVHNARQQSGSHQKNFWPASDAGAERLLQRSSDPIWLQRGLGFLIDKMTAKATSIGAQLVFVYLLSDQSLQSPPLPGVLETVNSREGRHELVFVDASRNLRALGSPDEIFLANGHLSPIANRIVSDDIAAALGLMR